MGYRQAVKAQHFDCCIVGSIPTSPVHGTLAQMVEHLTFNQVVGGSSPPCLTFFLFSFSFFLRRHKSLRRRILRVSNEPCTDKNEARRCEPCSQTDGHIFGRIRRMPRQQANAARSRACRHGELRGSEPCTDKNGDRRCEPCSPSPCTDNLILVLLCSYGGIGRRGRFRFCWASPCRFKSC